MTAPCASCPWRKSNTELGGTIIPGFDIDKARGLANTVGPGDEFRTIMACHGSAEDNPTICVGYAASEEGWRNLSVRIMAVEGLDVNAMWRACQDIDMHDSYASMMDALEAVEANR